MHGHRQVYGSAPIYVAAVASYRHDTCVCITVPVVQPGLGGAALSFLNVSKVGEPDTAQSNSRAQGYTHSFKGALRFCLATLSAVTAAFL